MKTNKKAILGFAVAMIFSLAFMQGVSKSNNHDYNQLTLGCAYGSALAGSEGNVGASATLGIITAVMYDMTKMSAVTLGWTGVGVAVTAGFGL